LIWNQSMYYKKNQVFFGLLFRIVVNNKKLWSCQGQIMIGFTYTFKIINPLKIIIMLFIRFCRSGFTTLPPVPLPKQYRCGSFVGGAQIARGVGYPGIWWTWRFTWFGPPEHNTLRPRVKGVVLMCLSARLRCSLFSPCVRACGVPWSSSPLALGVCPDLL
jgi:hypothetical protein